ncbi:MAG: 2TM domain-containing protein [Promethearchaeota archaeon]
MNQLSEDQIREEATKRVKAKRKFWSSFGAWATVNIVLIIIWALTDYGGYPWFLWPLCIWGFFVLLHFLQVYVFKQRIESREIDKEVENIKREQM